MARAPGARTLEEWTCEHRPEQRITRTSVTGKEKDSELPIASCRRSSPAYTAEDDGGALERALADTERHPADPNAVRHLGDELAAAGGRLGQIALELAPPYLSEQEAVDTILARLANDIGSDAKTILAARRYALTGDHRALDGTWLSPTGAGTGRPRSQPLRPSKASLADPVTQDSPSQLCRTTRANLRIRTARFRGPDNRAWPGAPPSPSGSGAPKYAPGRTRRPSHLPGAGVDGPGRRAKGRSWGRVPARGPYGPPMTHHPAHAPCKRPAPQIPRRPRGIA
ncbi:hypothetical protein GCM10010346_62650 [Streptomyces chryseus]|uniref:Uncharacterized protein n=1 Tax=Streptomyces chryseus TaxID=68186 RepID=A0ABQ3E9V2_9ACTN|nr:hypothetical protein GCM10010346_62650 [Streptomyces chryseus]